MRLSDYLLPLCLLMLWIWAAWKAFIPLFRLGFRWSFPLALLYTLWIGSFWGFGIIRIARPPEEVLPGVVLAVVLLVLYFSYPLLQGIAAHVIYARQSGTIPSWRSAFLKTSHRYTAILVTFSLILLVHAVVVFGVYTMFGHGWAEYFRIREASLGKFEVFTEALIGGFTFSAFVDMLPPIIFPFGMFVGLANPSSEFFFAMIIASLVAVGILFIPMLRFIFWLPLVTLREKESPFTALVRLKRASLGGSIAKEIMVVLRLFGLYFAFIVLFLLIIISLQAETAGFQTGLIITLGRWVAPVEMFGYVFVLLGIFPGIISLIFQQERIKLYRELFEAS